jgi:hypothetical protein
MMRASSEQERHALKAATRRACQMAGGVDAFAQATRVNQPALSGYGSPSEPEKFMPLDIVLDCDREAGAPVIVAELARLLGYRLVLADGGADATDVTMADLATISMDAARVQTEVAGALEDGRVSAAEAARIDAAIELQVKDARAMQARIRAARERLFVVGGERA